MQCRGEWHIACRAQMGWIRRDWCARSESRVARSHMSQPRSGPADAQSAWSSGIWHVVVVQSYMDVYGGNIRLLGAVASAQQQRRPGSRHNALRLMGMLMPGAGELLWLFLAGVLHFAGHPSLELEALSLGRLPLCLLPPDFEIVVPPGKALGCHVVRQRLLQD